MKDLDPLAPPSPELSRRAFVGIGAAAAALGAGIAEALAAGEGFGKFHPPIVAEDDPAIQTGRPALPRPGAMLDTYAAWPKNATAATPGVVVVMHIWGVDAQIRDVVRRLAKAGYIAIAPDLYARTNPPKGDTATDYKIFVPNYEQLADDQVDGDLDAAAAWIRQRTKGKIGVTGFCMGGTITLRQAVDSDSFAAAAVFYGKVRYSFNDGGGAATPMSLGYADEIKIPLLGSWGARDTGIPAADIDLLRKRLKVPNDLKIYHEAGHGFFDDQRPTYVASAESDAWTRVLRWFGTYLA